MLKRSIALAGALVGVCAAGSLAAAPSRAVGSTRSTTQIQADLKVADAEIAKLHYADGVKYNALYKKQMARVYGPLYARRDALLAEYAAATPKVAVACHHLIAVDDARLAFWGVDGAQARVDAAAGDADPATATDGKLAEQLVAWWSGRGDGDAQAKVADDVEAMAKAAPTSAPIADVIHLMLTSCSAPVPLGQRLTDDLCKTMGKTPVGKAYAVQPNRLEMPLAVEGTQVNGRPFKMSAWAGKVVLVDFWATWCPPCREEIPRVAKLYKDYHEQGFEIIGVSSDNNRRELSTFLQQHTEMPWPELFQQGNGWHPLTKKFEIFSIPRMYLVDRSGNLRSIEGREDMEDMVPKLLAEAYAPATPKTPAGRAGAKSTVGKPIGAPAASVIGAP